MLHATADPARAQSLSRFFKTGPGEYGEGDLFLGLTVPQVRDLERRLRAMPLSEIETLLRNDIHEARLLALCILVERYRRGSEAERDEIFALYIDNLDRVNNWDLVDCSAPDLVGRHLQSRDRALLVELAASPILWRRRVAILGTFHFIRAGEFAPTLDLCDRLIGDAHDLMHKACGWMLREVGKRDAALLESWLTPRAANMPRTMLRYAIERFSPERRKWYMGLKRAAA